MEYILSFIQQSSVYVIASVVLLGVLIFVHELGHFSVARWCGVRVEVFSLGFGPKIWKKISGDTTYCISLIPLGGYVKMFGEQPGETISDDLKSVSFSHKTVGQRIAIVLAGPLMNLFFAFVVFMVVAMIGLESREPRLGDIANETKAYQSGFRSGDVILAVNDQQVSTMDQVVEKMTQHMGQVLEFTVQRDQQEPLKIKAAVDKKENPNPLSLETHLGDIEGFTTLSRSSVVGIQANSPLWNLGLRTGDRITAIGDQKITYWREIEQALKTSALPVQITAERASNENKKSESLNIALALKPADASLAAFGVESSEFYLAKVVDGSPAALAGLKANDRIVAVNENKLSKWEDLLSQVKSYSGEGQIKFDVLRENTAMTFNIIPQVTTQMTAFGSEDKRYTVGVTPLVDIAWPDPIFEKSKGPLDTIVKGAELSWDFSVITVLSFVRLFQNKISPKTVGGLLSIGQAAGETMKMGLHKFLMMMAIISINLFILNLLPIPILDGGHLVFYTIEAIKGSPLSLKKIEMAQQVGFVLLMSLMVFALFNDVSRIILGRF